MKTTQPIALVIGNDATSPRRVGFAATIFLCLVGIAIRLQAGPLDVWHQRNPLPQGNTLNGVTYGNGIFVAVGDAGTVLTSADGVNWTVGNVGVGTSLGGITFGGGTFVAVGGSMIYTSTDGRSWKQIDPGPNDGLAAIAYGNGRFMAVGGGFLSRMNVATSTNLKNWTINSTRLSRPNRAIAFGGGVFRVVDEIGDWAETTVGASWLSSTYGTFDRLLTVAYGNGAFVAAGTGGDVNGVPNRIGTTNDVYGMVFAQGVFLAVGAAGITARSTDTVTWTRVDTGISSALRAVTFGNGVYVAVGDGGRIVSSHDGIDWTLRSKGPIDSLTALAYGDGQLVGVGEAGAAVTTTNGVDWSRRNTDVTAPLVDICFSRGVFVTIGNNDLDAVASVSSNGVNWTSTALGSNTTVTRVAASGNAFVVVGYSFNPQTSGFNGVANTSANGIQWSPHVMFTNSFPFAVAYGNGLFIAVGVQFIPPQQQLILSSSDGANWVPRVLSPGATLHGVAYGAHRFVAVGESGSVLVSTNGVSWESVSTGRFETLKEVDYGNGVFLARTSGSELLSSSDGVNWTPHVAPLAGYQSGGVSFGQGTFLMVGPQGVIFESDPLPPGGAAPFIISQPTNHTSGVGGLTTFTVVAGGDEPIGYQWLKNGTNILLNGGEISGATTATLTLGNVQSVDGGLYSAIATNSLGAVVSSNALLVVNQSPVADAGATASVVISSNGVTARVVLNATRSSDPDGDPLQYFWFGAGSTSAMATGAVAVAVLPIGTHPIWLVVSDGLATDTNEVTVTVLTTSQAVQRLFAQVTASWPRSQPLLATLEAALASLERHNPVSAINQLLAFQNKVRAQVSPQDSGLATIFIQKAEEIIDVLSGGYTNPGGRMHGRFTAVKKQPSGRVQMRFSAEPGKICILEASTNLVNWEMIGVATDRGNGSFDFEDADAARFQHRFYRAVGP